MIKTTLHTKFNLNEPTRNGTVYTKDCFNRNNLDKEVPVFTDYNNTEQIGVGKITVITDDYFETEIKLENKEIKELSKYTECCPIFLAKLETDINGDFDSDITFIQDAEIKSFFFDESPSFKTSKFTVSEDI